jgi:hypothetical protein
MQVIDHEPSGWFLVRDGGRLLLDVNCSHSAVSYEFLMELDEQERTAYAAGGHEFISLLAQKVQYSAPGVRGSTSPYRERLILNDVRAKVNEVTIGWLRERRGAL